MDRERCVVVVAGTNGQGARGPTTEAADEVDRRSLSAAVLGT